MNVFLAVLWKDLLTEWRSRDRVVAMLMFSLLVLLVFHFALPDGDPAQTRESAPGLLWIAYVFAALLGLNRALALELENDALAALALIPVDRGWVFLGKAAANTILLLVVQAVIAAAFALGFQVPLAPLALPLAGVFALGALGLCSVGTLLAAVAVRTQFREVMLPLLMLPLLIPVISGAVRATSEVLATGALPFEPIQLLVVADLIYLVVSFIGFDYVLEE